MDDTTSLVGVQSMWLTRGRTRGESVVVLCGTLTSVLVTDGGTPFLLFGTQTFELLWLILCSLYRAQDIDVLEIYAKNPVKRSPDVVSDLGDVTIHFKTLWFGYSQQHFLLTPIHQRSALAEGPITELLSASHSEGHAVKRY